MRRKRIYDYPNNRNKIKSIKKLAKKLNAHNITWAIGASLLLYFEGIKDDFHDIDIEIVEEDVQKVTNILTSLGTIQLPNPNQRYKTHHFIECIIDGVDIDVMAGFVIVKDGKEYDCCLTKDQITKHIMLDGIDIPLMSVEIWKRYYKLMERRNTVSLIESKSVQ